MPGNGTDACPGEPARLWYGRPMRKTTAALSFIIVIALGAAGVIAWNDTLTVAITTAEVPVPGLRRDVRILHASDLHGVTLGHQQSAIAAKLQGQRFDAAVINGDHIPTANAEPKPVLELLAVLQDHAPVVFVTRGNHDTSAVLDALAEHGALIVERGDNAVPLPTDAGRIVVTPAIDPGEAPADADLTLALGHYPMTASAITTAAEDHAGVSLFLFGHAHGGQIRLPCVGALWAPGEIGSDGHVVSRTSPSTLFPELRGRPISGLDRVGAAYRHISNGIGTQAVRLRFLAPAEITVITLVSK